MCKDILLYPIRVSWSQEDEKEIKGKQFSLLIQVGSWESRGEEGMNGSDVGVPAREVLSVVWETVEASDSCLHLLFNLGGLIGCRHIYVESRNMKAEGCRWLVSQILCPWVSCGEGIAKAAEHEAGTPGRGGHLGSCSQSCRLHGIHSQTITWWAAPLRARVTLRQLESIAWPCLHPEKRC